MTRKLALILLTMTAICGSNVAEADESNDWIRLFNGQDLTGWKVAEHPDSVRVEDGMLVVHGPRAHAFYMGEDGGATFKDFHFKAEVMTFPSANSGIYFHTAYLDRGWPNKGYEAQVNNTHRDPKKTGGLYSVQDNLQQPVKDNEWFTYEIIVKGKQIVIKIDGQTITDYTEPDDLVRPERQLSQGTFALQAHDPNSKVLYRNLMVRRPGD